MADVTLSQLERRFASSADGSNFILGPLDLTIPDGQLTVLAGPSGCGKTTLLRLIAGLERPSSGSVAIGGRPMAGVAPHRRDVAMVFQDHALYPNMTVHGNLAFPLKMRKVARREIDLRVRETAGMLEIDELLGRRPDQLSGGQQQRVALGRAVIRRPKVSLLDEPLAHLDGPLRAEMRDVLVALQRRLGLTMLHVTHDQAEAAAMSNRIVVLRQGQVEQVGTAEDLYQRPATKFVAGFFGTPPMNFLHGRLKGQSSECRFVSDQGLAVALSGERVPDPAFGDGREVILGIRPGDIELGPPGSVAETVRGDSGGNIVIEDADQLGRATAVERFDGQTIVRLELSGHLLTARFGGNLALAPGDSVALSFRPDGMHFFDPQDERLLARAEKS